MPGIHEDLSRSMEHKGGSDRSFGLVMAVFFAVIAFWPAIRGGQVRWWTVAAALILLILALSRPRILHVANRLWMKLALLISKVTNPVILALMYCLAFVPIGMMMRLSGKDPLRRRFDKSVSTYWIERRPAGPDPTGMGNQF